jgi:hypothetical protein
MLYCEAGDKPTIKYQFSGQNEKIYKSEFAPIEVVTKTTLIEGSSNYKSEGYGIGFIPLNGNGTYFWFSVVDHKIFAIPSGVDPIWGTTPRIALMYCGETVFSKLSNCSASRSGPYVECLQTFLFNGSFDIDPTRKCISVNNNKCTIQITYNGLTIFQDQGNCPVNFSVSCGNCPPGTEEHKSSIYPGYCCLDCASVASEIRGITNTIRGLTRG